MTHVLRHIVTAMDRQNNRYVQENVSKSPAMKQDAVTYVLYIPPVVDRFPAQLYPMATRACSGFRPEPQDELEVGIRQNCNGAANLILDGRLIFCTHYCTLTT